MSIPEWNDDAPVVGDVRKPKGDVILWFPGIGQKNSEVELFEKETFVSRIMIVKNDIIIMKIIGI